MFEDLGGNYVVEDSAEGESGKVALDEISYYAGFGSFKIPQVQIAGDHDSGEIAGYQACSGSRVESYRVEWSYEASELASAL